MSKTPLISVVMSVYNSEKYLTEAIESILNQTYENFEFIIVNDGSTDNSLEIIKEYIRQDERIVLIDRENKGLPYSLNEGINIAKGKYIARMDADDISLPERFEKQIEYMKKNELDSCGSYIKVFSENSNKTIVRKNPINHKDIKFTLLFFSCLAHPTVMFKKVVFDKVQYHIDYKVAQDYQLWVEISMAGFKIGNIPEVLLNYREHEAQASIEKFKRQQDTAHEIALKYANQSSSEKIDLIKKVIASKTDINFQDFKRLVNELIKISKDNNISDETIFIILKKIYIDCTPKSPFKYFIYLLATKSNDKDLVEELILFLKSFIIINRNSTIYKFLKKYKNNLKGK